MRNGWCGGATWQRCQFHLAQNAIHQAPSLAIRTVVETELRTVWNAKDLPEPRRDCDCWCNALCQSRPGPCPMARRQHTAGHGRLWITRAIPAENAYVQPIRKGSPARNQTKNRQDTPLPEHGRFPAPRGDLAAHQVPDALAEFLHANHVFVDRENASIKGTWLPGLGWCVRFR